MLLYLFQYDVQKVRPARPQLLTQAKVEVKVERRGQAFFSALTLALPVQKAGGLFQHRIQPGGQAMCRPPSTWR